MTKEDTLRRADQDLAEGRATEGRQRLRSLLEAKPDYIEAREMLAESYRRANNLAQAGRWAFATEQLGEAELAAFRKCFAHDPVQMMRALVWRGSEEDATSEVVRTRLRELRREAEAKAGTSLPWERPAYPRARMSGLARLLGFSVAILVLTCLVVGVVTVIQHVLGWL